MLLDQLEVKLGNDAVLPDSCMMELKIISIYIEKIEMLFIKYYTQVPLFGKGSTPIIIHIRL